MLGVLKRCWFAALYFNLAHFAFHRMRVVGASVPTTGPVLFVCLHRNGALDGTVYRKVAPTARFTLASQLRRSALLRFIFDGIEFLRTKDKAEDGARISNAAAFDACVAHLTAGGRLFFFPEGTSELGPRHLRFHPGVAQLIQKTVAQTGALTVVPLSAHYEAPTRWQRDVEVEVGPALTFGPQDSRHAILTRVTEALETVGLDCDTRAERETIETLAYAATLGQADISYAQALHCLAKAPPPGLADLQTAAAKEGLRLHQGIPLVPTQSALLYALLWLPLTAVVGFSALLNFPVVALAQWASRRFPDGANVVSFWRALAGTGAAYAWAPLVCLSLALSSHAPWIPGYIGLSLLGLKSLYRWQKLSIALYNASKASPALRTRLHTLHAEVVTTVRHQLGRPGGAQ